MEKEEYTTLIIDEKYNSIYGEIASFELIEKKSKFISYIFSIKNKDEAIEKLNIIKKIHYQAKHIVYIYSYIENNLPVIKFSDDGEPKGTGTKAIYELISKEKFTNICVIIVRYFGGILLGAGPLARTYLNCAKGSILDCNRKIVYNYTTISLNLLYGQYNKIEYILKNEKNLNNISNIDIEYNDNIKLTIHVKSNEKDRIEELIKCRLK